MCHFFFVWVISWTLQYTVLGKNYELISKTDNGSFFRVRALCYYMPKWDSETRPIHINYALVETKDNMPYQLGRMQPCRWSGGEVCRVWKASERAAAFGWSWCLGSLRGHTSFSGRRSRSRRHFWKKFKCCLSTNLWKLRDCVTRTRGVQARSINGSVGLSIDKDAIQILNALVKPSTSSHNSE